MKAFIIHWWPLFQVMAGAWGGVRERRGQRSEIQSET